MTRKSDSSPTKELITSLEDLVEIGTVPASALQKDMGLTFDDLVQLAVEASVNSASLAFPKLSLLDMLALSCFFEICDQIEVSLERLESVLNWMTGNKPTHLEKIIEMQSIFELHCSGLSIPKSPVEALELLQKANDEFVGKSLLRIIRARWPIFSLLLNLSLGHKMFFKSDLKEDHQFLSESNLAELAQFGILLGSDRKLEYLLPLNEIMNEVLEAVELKTFEITNSTRNFDPYTHSVSKIVAEQLLKKDYDSILIEFNSDNEIRLVFNKNIDLSKSIKLGKIIDDIDFGHLDLFVNHGKITQIRSKESIKFQQR